MATANCSSSGAMPCHSATFSIKDTPRPLLVLATMHFGLPLSERLRARSYSSLMIKPGHRMLDYYTEYSQSRTVCVIHRLGQKWPDLAPSYGIDVGLPAIPSIAQKAVGTKAGTATSTRHSRNRVKQYYRLSTIQDVCGCCPDGQRHTAAIDNHVSFAALLRPVGRVGSGMRPQKTARTEALSTTARENSSFPFRPKCRSNTLWSCAQTPALVQAFIRRQQVGPLGASSAGMAFQAEPVRRTKRIPTRHSRSLAGGRPPLGRGGAGGSKGDISAHSLSDTHSRAMSFPP